MNDIKKELNKLADKKQAEILQRFFKTGKGQYAEGDKFLGLTVPQSRQLARKYTAFGLVDLKKMLRSPFHEERLIALLILVEQFSTGDEAARTKIKDFYLKFLRRVNNWDLVDLSAGKILGTYLLDKPKSLLFKMAQSINIWERRVAMIATSHFIAHHRFQPTLQIAEILASRSLLNYSISASSGYSSFP